MNNKWTKMKLVITALFVTILMTVSVTAVTRYVNDRVDVVSNGTYYYSGNYDFYSNSHFNVTNKIQNSKGLILNASAPNLQIAINDLGSTAGGWVTVPYNFTVGTPTNPYNVRIIDSGKTDNHDAYTWIIYREGGYTCLKNCSSGQLQMRNTNTTTIFRYAINNPSGGDISIFVKSGSYVITGVLPIVNHLRITGDCINAPQLVLSSTSQCNLFEYNTASLIYFFTLEHLTLVTSSTWINVTGVKTNSYVCDGLIFDCFIMGFNGTNSAGIDLGTTWGWRVTQSVFEFNRDGIKLHGGSNGNIANSKIQQNWGHGINMTGAQNDIISGCYITSNKKAGVYLTGSSEGNLITGNIISSNNKAGASWSDVYVDWAFRNVYTNNIMNGASYSKYNIYIAYGHNDTILGNYLTGATTGAIGTSSYYSIRIRNNDIIRDNKGYVTEKWGNTSVANNGTISHGLSYTPYFVSVTCQNWNLTAQVTQVNATLFKVSIRDLNTDLPPGGNYQIFWYAKTT